MPDKQHRTKIEHASKICTHSDVTLTAITRYFRIEDMNLSITPGLGSLEVRM